MCLLFVKLFIRKMPTEKNAFAPLFSSFYVVYTLSLIVYCYLSRLFALFWEFLDQILEFLINFLCHFFCGSVSKEASESRNKTKEYLFAHILMKFSKAAGNFCYCREFYYILDTLVKPIKSAHLFWTCS